MAVLLAACVLAGAVANPAAAEQAAQPTAAAAGGLDVGGYHSCASLPTSGLGCWGWNGVGQLGYPSTGTVGDDETPGSVGPVNLGVGRTVAAIAAGTFHSCALLDDGTVRCWGFGGDGRLGYGNTNDVGDPNSVGPVDLGLGRTATAISAGEAHTCAVLDDGSVLCWGFGGGGFPIDGRLGYGNTSNVGDDETPGSVGPVPLGPNAKAVAITAGGTHTCALLDDHTVKCWGRNDFGQLGYANVNSVGDTPTTTPDTVGPVELGAGRRAKALSTGDTHTCALLDDGTVRCWGNGAAGRLGYGNENNVGDDETPAAAGPVNLGATRTASAISAGAAHTCAVLDDGTVRCWGLGAFGRLGYGNQHTIGDDETPGAVGPVDVGAGRTATAISAGMHHTCARLGDDSVRCWGKGANGRLGYCNEKNVGDDETPASAGPVNLSTGVCSAADPQPAPAPAPAPTPPVPPAPLLVACGIPDAAGYLHPAKLRVSRARVLRENRRLDVLAPITSRARGADVAVTYQGDGRTDTFDAKVSASTAALDHIRFREPITRGQARLGTGIVNLNYLGDEDTRSEFVRLRAASQRAELDVEEISLIGDRLSATGSVTSRAEGVVRFRYSYVDPDGTPNVHEARTRIQDDGNFELEGEQVPAQLARCGGYLSIQFTGYFERRIRGEQLAYQLDPGQTRRP